MPAERYVKITEENYQVAKDLFDLEMKRRAEFSSRFSVYTLGSTGILAGVFFILSQKSEIVKHFTWSNDYLSVFCIITFLLTISSFLYFISSVIRTGFRVPAVPWEVRHYADKLVLYYKDDVKLADLDAIDHQVSLDIKEHMISQYAECTSENRDTMNLRISRFERAIFALCIAGVVLCILLIFYVITKWSQA
jgi:hypothetical protein